MKHILARLTVLLLPSLACAPKGGANVGLWICNSRNRLPGQEQVDSDTYWSERLGWSVSHRRSHQVRSEASNETK